MNPQDELFHEDWRDSLRHLVKALGGVDTVGHDLWPNKTRKSAGTLLSDCLNSDRPHKIDLEDIEALLRMGRESGVHCAFYHLADVANYERPKPAAPKSPKTELLERQAALSAELARVGRDLDRLEGAQALKAVKK